MIININTKNHIKSLIVCIPFAIIGGIIYILISYKIGLLDEVFGEKYVKNILRKLKITKEVKKC